MNEDMTNHHFLAQQLARDGIYCEEIVTYKAMHEMHYHGFYELFYVIRGRREYFIGDSFFLAEEGDTVIVPPGVLHRTDGGTASRILVHFTSDFLQNHFSDAVMRAFAGKDNACVLHATPEDEPRLGRLFARINTAYRRNMKSGTPPSQDGETVFLLGEILFLLSGKNMSVKISPNVNGRLAETVKYINEHYASIRNIEQIAEKFYFSKYYLCHLFRELLGVSIISYLNMVKVRAACALMQNEDLCLTEIAGRCGFNSSAYFCKVFREVEGVSPSNYRHDLLAGNK